MIVWHDYHHSELNVADLYAILALRCAVFVVEQHCQYLDVDGDDLIDENRHILAKQHGQLVAYARILSGKNDSTRIVIGRVIVDVSARGKKRGHQLMEQVLATCQQRWPEKTLYLGAQAHLQAFYSQFGFRAITDVYDEDGIPHIGMEREHQ